MSDTLLSCWFELEGGLPNDEVAVVIPPAGNEITYNVSFDLKPTDLFIPLEGGAYVIKLLGNIMYPSSPPETGYCRLELTHYISDGAGGEQPIPVASIWVDAGYVEEGLGDYPWHPMWTDRKKTELYIAETSGRLVLNAVQNTPEEPVAIMGNIQIAKL